MRTKLSAMRVLRWILAITTVVVGVSVTWAWGQVARLAEPSAATLEPQPPVLRAIWQPEGAGEPVLFHSLDEGNTWAPTALPREGAPVAWADGDGNRLAVALEDGWLLMANGQDASWASFETQLPILDLVWDQGGNLYLGTDSQGVYRLNAGESALVGVETPGEMSQSPLQHLAISDGRLFASTSTAIFYTDEINMQDSVQSDANAHPTVTWIKSLPVPGRVSAMVATTPEMVFVGTETAGVFKSTDAGQTWQPAMNGLGLAAGQMVKITALRADSQETGVLYAAVNHVTGSTQVHMTAEGTFVTLSGGVSWQPLSGPAFPEAIPASDLLTIPGKPLYVQAVTSSGLEVYEPDVVAYLAALRDGASSERVMAARYLGIAQATQASDALLAALADPDPAVGLTAADALGRIAAPDSVGGLLVAMEHPNEQVRLGAARALGMMGVDGAVGSLRTMLLNGEGTTVTVAAEALGRIGSPAAVDALLVALADSYMSSRRHAAQATLEAMGEQAVAPLTSMLESSDGYARRNAAQTLGWIGSPQATPSLVVSLADRSAAVRGQAAWALGEIGDPAATAALERAMSRDPEAMVQAAAEAALVLIEQQPVASVSWPASWAPALQRMPSVRWLILGLSLTLGAWLAVANTRPSPQRLTHS